MSGDVRIFNAALEDDVATGRIIIRGVLDQQTLKYIGIAWYQREQGFSKSHTDGIVGAYFSGGVHEDIVIGMRGKRCDSKDGVYLLRDKCYCINGGQRLYAAALAMKERPDIKLNLGVKAYTDTDEKFENDMFIKLGTSAKRIAASIMIRNKRKESRGAALLVAMNKEPKFALKDRISWDQIKSRYELLTGLTFTKIVGRLHAHKAPLKSSTAMDLVAGFDLLLEIISEEQLAANIIRFFDAIDKCWTLRQIADSYQPHPQLNPGFLQTIAELFSAYPEFWDGAERTEFYFGDTYARKLRGFKLSDYLHSTRKFPKDALYEVLRKRLDLKPIMFQDDEKETDKKSTKARSKSKSKSSSDEARPT